MVKPEQGLVVSGIEQLAKACWEDRNRVLTVLGDVFPYMDIIELHSPSGRERVEALLNEDDDRGTVLIAFRYQRSKTCPK